MDATESSGGLEDALREFAIVVGADAVLTARVAVNEYRDPYSPPSWPDTAPLAVLRPASVEEVQEVVRIAVRHDIRLWVHSLGKNNGYGGASARTRDAVVVNLGRMNRVLEFNEELGYVVVEPGVSYNELYEYLQTHGSKYWMDCPDIGWGSLIGNTTEHGVGFTAYGDHASAVCGTEVILPDGDLLRTGMGALSDSKTWHVSKRGFGPAVDELFMQSNFGIVTKMGFWLMPQPEIYKPCLVSLESEEHLTELLDAIRPFVVSREIPNQAMLFNPMAVAASVLKRPTLYSGTDPVPQDVIAGFAAEAGLGEWNVRLALYGTQIVVDDVYGRLEAAISTVPGANIVGTSHRGDALPVETFDQSTKVQAGIPDMSMAMSSDFWGRPGGHVIFTGTTPLTGRDAKAIVDLVRDGAAEAGVDLMCGALLNQRAFIMVVIVVYPLDDDDAAARSHAFCERMVPAAASLGYGEYRAHTSMMDLVADQFDYNDHAMRRFYERIKDTLDPTGILTPGKQGIWPRRDREVLKEAGL